MHLQLRKRRAGVVGATVAALWMAGHALAQAPSPAIDETTSLRLELHLARVENAQLRAALARMQTELETIQLTRERAELEQRVRLELQPPDGHVFDWATKRFMPPQEPPK